MKLWLKLLAAFSLGLVAQHVAEEIGKTLRPPGREPGIWSASDDVTLDHVERPAIQPPPVIGPEGIASAEAMGTPSLS